MEYREPISLDGAIKMYINNVSCYCSKRTIEYYKENLDRFLSWIKNSDYMLPFSEDVEISRIDNQVIMSYIHYLRSCDIKNVSINTYVRAVKVFASYLYDNEYVNVYWFSKFKKLRDDHDPVIPLTEKEYTRIIEHLSSRENSLRNILIFRLMSDCGLRLGEVINLDIPHIHEGYLIVVDSKYNKNRFVPLPDDMYRQIKNLTAGRVAGPIFLTRNKERITKSAITKVFVIIKQQLNLYHVHPHQLRHTFATSYVAGGGNLEVLRLLLGHSELMITQNYLHLAQEIMITGIDIHKLDDIFFVNYRNIR